MASHENLMSSSRLLCQQLNMHNIFYSLVLYSSIRAVIPNSQLVAQIVPQKKKKMWSLLIIAAEKKCQ